ncbi:CubicO group peptidase (beta-lactamase class C family) [Flavobacterium cutihirudinis]|uniref:CubicO group peptidase (Beta-lactamase class C family) n=1 Tax=Flavobacterium cutihirudinis TaxID=1265740 RepID=A0A3D9G228_9FLAO|nr:serine hydrolase domain-containing protein [Flavobacterium cutihirudinis]RED27223.1 CubicO group peptidase (beta-lactamase class C family) [Flavobacterium cutihirudinis]
MKLKFCAAFVFGIVTLSANAQKLDNIKLDSLFQALNEKNLFMGNISISKNGNEIYSNSIGKADVESNKALTKDTKFRIGSTTKIFTSALVLKAVENKKITLNQTINTFFPTIVNSQKITIRNLLNHRSGIHELLSADEFSNGYTEAKSQEEMISIISKFQSDFEPNTKADYSNSNYYLLTLILEKVYKKTYSELLNEQIIKPLRLKNTYFGGKISIQNNECYSYYFSTKWEKDTQGDMSVPLGAGAIVSTTSDLTFFIEKLFEGKIISKESLKTMTQIQDKYGMGIFELPFYDKKGFVHRGQIDSFSSLLSYFPNEKLSIAIITNGAVYDKKKILTAALSNYFNKPNSINFETYQPAQQDLEKIAGTYKNPKNQQEITITINNKRLYANFRNQSLFLLEPVSKDKFENIWEGNKIDFQLPNEMTFEADGEKLKFLKI